MLLFRVLSLILLGLLALGGVGLFVGYLMVRGGTLDPLGEVEQARPLRIAKRKPR